MGLEITILGDNPVYIKIDPGTYEIEEMFMNFKKDYQLVKYQD